MLSGTSVLQSLLAHGNLAVRAYSQSLVTLLFLRFFGFQRFSPRQGTSLAFALSLLWPLLRPLALRMSSDMLSREEWAQLKLWLIEARLKASTGSWSAEDWFWHWVIDSPTYVPMVEIAELWQGTGNYDACQWLIHWVESVDIGNGFDVSPPAPAFAPERARG